MKGLYSIYDSVSKEFCGPWIDNNDAAAARRFQAWIAQSSSQPNFKSTDYSLHCLGSFHLDTGEIVPGVYEVAVNEGDKE